MGEINTKVSRLKYTRAQMNEPAAVQLTCYDLPSIIPWLSPSRNNVGPVAMTTKQAAQHYSSCIYSDDNEAVDHMWMEKVLRGSSPGVLTILSHAFRSYKRAWKLSEYIGVEMRSRTAASVTSLSTMGWYFA